MSSSRLSGEAHSEHGRRSDLADADVASYLGGVVAHCRMTFMKEFFIVTPGVLRERWQF